MNPTFLLLPSWLIFLAILPITAPGSPRLAAADRSSSRKPVFLYCRYFNAEGESRYQPDGTYSEVLARLRNEFEVRVSSQVPTPDSLRDVQVILISNPSDRAVQGHPAPPHFSDQDVETLTAYVAVGGGLILMGNQENHNLEVEATNRLLRRFGLQFKNVYTDVKRIEIPKSTPILGGLCWGYYTGNSLGLDPGHAAHPRPLVKNDISHAPLNGPRNPTGVLLAVAELGQGRVVAVTDAGWISNSVLADQGIGGVAVPGQQNWEIFRRLSLWAAGR